VNKWEMTSAQFAAVPRKYKQVQFRENLHCCTYFPVMTKMQLLHSVGFG